MYILSTCPDVKVEMQILFMITCIQVQRFFETPQSFKTPKSYLLTLNYKKKLFLDDPWPGQSRIQFMLLSLTFKDLQVLYEILRYLCTYMQVNVQIFFIWPKFQNLTKIRPTTNNRFDSLIDPKSSQTKIFNIWSIKKTTTKRSLSEQTCACYIMSESIEFSISQEPL